MPASVPYLVIVGMTICGAFAGYFLKRAAADLEPRALLVSGPFWAGAGLYGICALCNIWVLRHLDLSVVLPLTALTYVWTMGIARMLLGERITLLKGIGVGLILLGALLIAR